MTEQDVNIDSTNDTSTAPLNDDVTSSNNSLEQSTNVTPDLEQIYEMIKEKDEAVSKLQNEVSELKKANTQLLLKVNMGEGAKTTEEQIFNFMDAFRKERG